MLGPLERELDVHIGCDRLDRAAVLRVVEEISNAGLEMFVPFEYVEMGVHEGLLRGTGIVNVWKRHNQGMCHMAAGMKERGTEKITSACWKAADPPLPWAKFMSNSPSPAGN